MAVQIRQEINVIDHICGSNTSGVTVFSEIVQLDTTQYNGTVTYYIEFLAINTDSVDKAVSLAYGAGSGTAEVTINITAGTSAYTLFRTSWTTSVAIRDLYLKIAQTTSTNQVLVKSARIVIIQNATTLTNTETQIEIGNYNLARTTESAIALVNPKYWKYDASKWDGTKTFYAEAVYNSGDHNTISVYLYEATDITAPSWTLNATIVSAATTTTHTRTRVAFTPVDGQWYTIFSLNGSMDNHDIYNAKVVVDQGVPVAIDSYSESDYDTDFSVASGTAVGVSQSFTGDGSTVVNAKFYIYKSGSPTGNATANIYAHSGVFGTSSVPTGAALATSDSVDVATLSTSISLVNFAFSGANQITLTNGTKYVVTIEYSGGGGANTVRVGYDASSPSHAGNNALFQGGVWTANSGRDTIFYVNKAGTAPTLIEPQYLLANTLFAAGTALQTFLTKWDSTEWDDGAGSIAYYYQAEAA